MSASSRLPVSIDPWRLAAKRAQLAGEVPITAFDRLCGLVQGHADQVQIALEFEPGRRGQALVTGKASVDIELVCQRCLNPVQLVLHTSVRLGVVQTEVESERLLEGYEPLITEQQNLRIESLVEDDLILALPHVVCHTQGECDFPTQSADVGKNVGKEEQSMPKDNPFDVLKNFKTD